MLKGVCMCVFMGLNFFPLSCCVIGNGVFVFKKLIIRQEAIQGVRW